MKQRRLLLTLIVGLSLLSLNTGCKKEIVERVIETKTSSVILSGRTAPSPIIGKEGDFYIDLSSALLYGPKTGYSWGTPISLRGEQGKTGATGPKGDKGERGERGYTGARGEKGEQGETGATGPKGDKGERGERGYTGARGEKGERGEQGQRGSQIFGGIGVPSFSLGQPGDWYIDKTNKKLYGPKDANGWGQPVDLVSPSSNSSTSGNQGSGSGNNSSSNNSSSGGSTPSPGGEQSNPSSDQDVPPSSTITARDYSMSGRTLNRWINKDTRIINMTNHPDLSTITSIEFGAFIGCTNLTTVVIPSSVTSIGDAAFSGCRSLKNITIPYGVKTIGWSMFRNCSSLTSIVIPSSVTELGTIAFEGCTGLTSIVIPSSVTTIGINTFVGCSNLTEITFSSQTPPSVDLLLGLPDTIRRIRVPKGAIDQYRDSFFLRNYRDKVIGY